MLGPWRHSGVNYDGTALGPLKFEGDTALQFRRNIMQPFLDEHLRDGAPKADTPPVFVFETGTNVWRRLPSWPLSCASGLSLDPTAPVPAAERGARLRGAAQECRAL